MQSRELAIQYAQTQKEQFLSDLEALVKIKSISTDPESKPEMIAAAGWLKDHLLKIGCQKANIYETKGHPVVFGELTSNQNHARTVLIYGHYDVQPADPLNLWKTNPFKPVVNGDYLFGRGASDMKGQIIACTKAIEAVFRHNPDFPLNFKFIFEGEEEIGSPNLPDFLSQHKDMLAGDIVLNSDAGMYSLERPAITYGLRGLAYFEIKITGPKQDLHSGQYGGIIHNPAQVLCEVIAKMHDDQGKVTLPGFYDNVREISITEQELIQTTDLNDEYFLEQTGVPKLWGEQGYNPVERIGTRPTLEVNGIESGFYGAGAKTIIPSSALAKISTRLVPDQEPASVRSQLEEFLKQNVPSTVRWELVELAGGPASLVNLALPELKSLVDALERVWGIHPAYQRSGGSIPVVVQMQTYLGIDSLLTGFSLPDDNIHAPDERLHLPTIYRGIDALIHFLYNLV